MRRFTTPTMRAKINADLTGCDVHLTFRQGKNKLTITSFEETEVNEGVTTLTFTLTQQMTAMFCNRDSVRVQANIVDQAGHRVATNRKLVRFDENLLNRILEGGDNDAD